MEKKTILFGVNMSGNAVYVKNSREKKDERIILGAPINYEIEPTNLNVLDLKVGTFNTGFPGNAYKSLYAYDLDAKEGFYSLKQEVASINLTQIVFGQKNHSGHTALSYRDRCPGELKGKSGHIGSKKFAVNWSVTMLGNGALKVLISFEGRGGSFQVGAKPSTHPYVSDFSFDGVL